MVSKKANTILVYSNMNIAVLDEEGNQITELQRFTLVELIIDKAKSLGIHVDGATIYTTHDEYEVKDGKAVRK